MAARKKSTSDVVHDEEGRVDLREAAEELTALIKGEVAPTAATEGDLPGLQADPVQPTITKLQLHTRAHILGIQGTSDSLVVGDVIESIEPDMLGPIPGFVVRLKRGAPVFMPQASVLAVTVVG